jgi:hypothetical protein
LKKKYYFTGTVISGIILVLLGFIFFNKEADMPEKNSAISKPKDIILTENVRIKKQTAADINIRQFKNLKEIKDVYKKIDEIVLYDGRVINGLLVAKGNIFKIMTPEGMVVLPFSGVGTHRIIK